MKNKELTLTDKSFLVSETNEQGIIKFANNEFCKYSEYSLEELLGKPHNIVRDPDMPKAVFKELWSSVKEGKRWRGFVKNKTKNGNFYWVFATIFPFTSSDGSKGYISCRRKASQKEIEKYEDLYLRMKMEKKS
jgi:aerotaxis receptor